MTRGIVVDPVADEDREPSSTKPGTESQDTEQHESALPEKFRGKSPTEIVEMYTNLEQETGRLRNEVGEVRAEARTWRSFAEEVGKTRRQTEDEQPKPRDDISGDTLLADPVNTIRSVLDSVLDERLKPVTEKTDKLERNTEAAQFVSDYPNYVEVGNDPEFQQFVAGSVRRAELAQAAIEKNDVGAMRRLMEDWTERQELIASLKPKQESQDSDDDDDTAPTGVDGARKSATEAPGSGGSTSSKKVFYQTDVIDTMLRNPDKYYSAPYQKELMAAMKDGRFRS